jgi:hypothetical protein
MSVSDECMVHYISSWAMDKTTFCGKPPSSMLRVWPSDGLAGHELDDIEKDQDMCQACVGVRVLRALRESVL